MAENNEESKRIIGALVQCSESGKPIANAKVYQRKGNVVALTNNNGLASLVIDGNLKQSVQVEVQGYKTAGFPVNTPKKDGKPYVFNLKREKETENQTKYAEVIPPIPKPKSKKGLYIVIAVLSLGLAVVLFLYVKEKRVNKGGLPKPPTPIPTPKPKVNPVIMPSKPKVKMI